MDVVLVGDEHYPDMAGAACHAFDLSLRLAKSGRLGLAYSGLLVNGFF